MPDYRFPGMPDFAKEGGVRPSLRSRATNSWLNARLCDALSQIPLMRPEHRAASFEEAREIIKAIRHELDTAITAFDNVMANCPPPPSPDDPPVAIVDPFSTVREVVEDEVIPDDPEPMFTPRPRGRPRKDATT